jgi:TetR/AcrR family transcriptional repressor of nem operon
MNWPGRGCPIAALGGDVARGATALKARFGAGARRIIGLLARDLPGSEKARRARAARQLAMMAGAIMIARASDPETARDVLAACREHRP